MIENGRFHTIPRRKLLKLAVMSLTALVCPSELLEINTSSGEEPFHALTTPHTTPDNTSHKPKRCPLLGIRNNVPELMEYIPRASFARVVGDRDKFYEDESQVKESIHAAKKQGLGIYYTDNPQMPISVPRIRQKVDDYMACAGQSMEVVAATNEVDDVFWKGNFTTVAPFILVLSDYIFNKFEWVQIAIGGLADVERITDLLYCLRNPDYSQIPDFDLLAKEEKDYIQSIKFHPERFIYTFHAYYDPETVTDFIRYFKNALIKEGITNPVIWGEEIGIKGNKTKLPEMLNAALNNGASKVIIHELPDIEGYGLMRPLDKTGKKWTANEYYLNILNWSESHLAE